MGQTSVSSTVNDWDDTWFFALGADYRVNNQWTVRGGVAYDMDPNSDQKKRMAVIPDTDRVWVSLGASYKYDDNLTFDFGGTYIKGVGDKELWSEHNKLGQQTKHGEYDSLDSFIFAAAMQYRF
jgi:long-chain fatty acid transport protein